MSDRCRQAKQERSKGLETGGAGASKGGQSQQRTFPGDRICVAFCCSTRPLPCSLAEYEVFQSRKREERRRKGRIQKRTGGSKKQSAMFQALAIAYVTLTLAGDGKGPLLKEEVGERKRVNS